MDAGLLWHLSKEKCVRACVVYQQNVCQRQVPRCARGLPSVFLSSPVYGRKVSAATRAPVVSLRVTKSAANCSGAQPLRVGRLLLVLQLGKSLASPARRGRRRPRCPGRLTHTRPSRQNRSSRRRTFARSSRLAGRLARWRRPCRHVAHIFHEEVSPLSRRRARRHSLRMRTTEYRC